jgi:broad specificity phosphatase PhoE
MEIRPMQQLRQLILVRHGETVGQSSIRFYGSTDVELSPEGRDQMRQAAGALFGRQVDLVGASPLKRSWQSAYIVGRGAQVRLIEAFREVDFGRWEGFTAEEIQDTDPTRYAEWQQGGDDFVYPSGEARPDFRRRVAGGLNEFLETRANSALLVLHKGVIRIIVDTLCDDTLPDGEPALGEMVCLTRQSDGRWAIGSPSSNPAALRDLDAA